MLLLFISLASENHWFLELKFFLWKVSLLNLNIIEIGELSSIAAFPFTYHELGAIII